MSIELTEGQLKALAQTEETPARVIDPRTRETFVLLPADLYERVQPLLRSDTTSSLTSTISPVIPHGVRASRDAFLHDLPQLLANPAHEGTWVAYGGDERIGFATTQRELIQECLRRGLTEEQFYIDRVAPRTVEPEQVDPSLFEFEDLSECRAGPRI